VNIPRRIFAVVLNWNGGGELNRDCLESLIAEGIPEERIVFIDNGSTDGSLEEIRERFPALQLVENPRNLGYGEGCNQGAREALELGADTVFFVNNDLTLESGSLAKLVESFERHPQAGFVGPRVLAAEDNSVVWCAGGELSWRQNLSTLRGHGMRDGAEYRRELKMDYLPGCALLARRRCLEQVGLFDADYFAYMEDVDLGVRAVRAGWESWLIGEAAAFHASSSATGGGYNPRRKYMMGVNSIWFLRTHGTSSAWMRFFVFDVVSLPFVWLLNVPRGRGRSVVAKAWGIFAGLRGKRVRAADVEPGGTWLW